MKRVKYEYEAKAIMSYTREEATILLRYSANHYDGHCRAVGKPGERSFLWGMTHFLRLKEEANDPTAQWDLSYRELDLLCKIMEKAGNVCNSSVTPEEHHLYLDLRTALHRLSEELTRVNAHPSEG